MVHESAIRSRLLAEVPLPVPADLVAALGVSRPVLRALGVGASLTAAATAALLATFSFAALLIRRESKR